MLESALTPYRLGMSLQNDYPELVENYMRLLNFQSPSILLEYKNKHFNQKNFFVADSSLFDILNFKFSLLADSFRYTELNTVLISESVKNKYFGNYSPLGKKMFLNGIPFVVSGVFKDTPIKSHFHFDVLVSFKTFEYIIGHQPNSWLWNSCWTYIVLNENAQAQELENKFPEFIQKHYDNTIKDYVSLFLQDLPSIHLGSELEFEIQKNNKKLYLYIILAVAGFLLFISIINFVSLRIADSLTRIKESGIRKILGSSRLQLILQFLIESALLSFAALIMALFWVELFLPLLNYYT